MNNRNEQPSVKSIRDRVESLLQYYSSALRNLRSRFEPYLYSFRYGSEQRADKSLRERVKSTLQYCSSAYRNPQSFFDSYSYFFRDSMSDEYLSEPVGDEQTLHAKEHEGKLTLSERGKLLPLSLKDIIHHWLGTVDRTLREIPMDQWNISVLQQKLLDVFESTEPHPKMVQSDWRRKKIEIQLFLRWALMANRSGPSNAVAMAILGKKLTLQRLQEASKIVMEESVQ